ncbi:MAG TPA: hypothetical protein VMI56_19385 [Reyranella sp.]|nr:hypothetical protein [Reyranella sp.]
MTRLGFIAAVALGGIAVTATALAAPPYPPVPAQGRAEIACRDQGVAPRSAAWEVCLSQVTRAYEWGESALAQQLAKAAGEARESCLELGLQPDSMGYRSCVDKEVDARNQLLILGNDTSGENVAEAPQ